MQEENVARIGCASGRTAEQQRNFAIGLRMLGKIVVKSYRMTAAVAEVFAHGASGKWSNVLHGGRLGGGSDHNDAVIHGAEIGESLDNLRHGGTLLPDGAVDANHISATLIQDGVQNNSGLAGLAIADDQFALPAANGNHGVNGFDSRLQWLAYRL